MIIAHSQFELLEKLITALDDERNDIYVHIDAKVSGFDFERFAGVAKHSRVVFTPERIDVTWGDYSQVRCEMLLLKTAIDGENAEKPYDYYHLLSGADLPIKSNDGIHAFFDENAGKEFIHHTSDTVNERDAARIRYYHFFRHRRNFFNKLLGQLLLIPQKTAQFSRLPSNDFTVRKGSNWFSITGDFAHYIVANSDRYDFMFRNSYCGDEVFVQTVAANSEYAGRLFMPQCNDDHFACARLIDWERGNPYIWRTEDFDLIKSSPCMFARKFDLSVDSNIVDLILDMTGKKANE
jgi:hypothetical protein